MNVLYAFSATLSEGVALVYLDPSVSDLPLNKIWQFFPPAKVTFAGAGVLLLVSGSSGMLFADSRERRASLGS